MHIHVVSTYHDFSEFSKYLNINNGTFNITHLNMLYISNFTDIQPFMTIIRAKYILIYCMMSDYPSFLNWS